MQDSSDEWVISGRFWLDRIRTLGSPFGNSLFWIGIGIVLWLACLGYSLYRFRGAIRENVNPENETFGLQLALFGCVHLIWWFLRTESAWWRYLLPGYLALSILAGTNIAELMNYAFKQMLPPFQISGDTEYASSPIVAPGPGSRSIQTGFAALVLALTILHPLQLQAVRLPQEIRQTHHYQRRLAGQIRDLSDRGAVFGYWGWFQAPELSFLAQVQFYDISESGTRKWLRTRLQAGEPVYVIVADVQKGMAPETIKQVWRFLGKLVIHIGEYRIYELKNKSLPEN